MLPVKLVEVLLGIIKPKKSEETVLNCFEAKEGIVTALTPRLMINVEDPDCGNAYYSYTGVKRLKDLAKVDKLDEVDISSSLPLQVEGAFPLWENILPANVDDFRRVAFDVKHLKDLCEVAIASGSPVIEMYVPNYEKDQNGNLYDFCTTPVLFFWELGTRIGRGLLSPFEVRPSSLQSRATLLNRGKK